ncbi:MAG: ABC transporter permease, partial [Abiotrophia defectiva]|nr:ABC transporter permease [Abiotrophia defectiva]
MKDQQSLWMKLEKTVGLQKLIALIALIVIFGFFAISSESFRSFDTAVSILDASYY